MRMKLDFNEEMFGEEMISSDKRKLEMEQGGSGLISFTAWFIYFSNSLLDLL